MGSMRVAFDSRPAGKPDGIGRYATYLLAELKRRLEIVGDHPSRAVDVYHTPWLQGALLRSPCPMVVTIHTLLDLKRPAERLRSAHRLKLRYLAVKRAARVIVPSRAVAEDLVRHLSVERFRIAVIPPAAAAAFGPRPSWEVAALRQRLGVAGRYLLWVGDLRRAEDRRQLARLTAALRQLPLVAAGPTGRWAPQLPNTILAGRLTDDELSALYTGAQALLLPNETEGFALFAQEALKCSTPVVACDLAPLREVLDGQATFVPAGDLGELVAAAERAQRPASPPPAWSWKDAAEATVCVYQEAVADAARGRFPLVGPPPPAALAPPPSADLTV